MSRAPASASWDALGETFYRRVELYTMQWHVADLSDYIVAGSKWGGPVALIRDERKPVLLGKHPIGKPRLQVYSAAGALLQTIQWDSKTRITALGWTSDESLVVLTQDGTYRIYPLSVGPGTPSYSQHHLGPEAQEAGVIEAQVYEEGMVVLLGNLTFVHVTHWRKPQQAEDDGGDADADASLGGKVVQLANTGLSEPPTCWSILPPNLSQSRGLEVLIAAGNAILRLDEIDCVDQRISRGPFLKISPSPNGRFLGLLSSSSDGNGSQLWVASSDFSRSLSEYDLTTEGEPGPPSQVVWCGDNTVVVAWDRTVVMVGPFGETLKYYYAEPVVLVGEIDGTRIVSQDAHELLQIVPQSSQDVFQPGSTSPSAILFEASDLFDKRSPKADEFIRNIRSELVSAVDTCIAAAGQEFDPHWQKKLLKAATFGKAFLDLYNPSSFVEMTQALRVLNAVRHYEIGIPLTHDQYKARRASRLVARLTARSQHLLALRISSFLRLSTAPVLKHWAQAKIASTTSPSSAEEDAVCREIVLKLRDQADVSCADVARTAWSTGKSSLATKLLEHEPRASKQVPLLLSMKQEDSALTKAIDSGDPNLVYTVLIQLRRTHALGDFFRFVDRKPEAAALLRVWAKDNDVEMLRDFYYQDDRWKETACLELEESLSIKDFGERVARVRAAAKSFGDDKDCSFEAKMTEDYVKLLALQQSLEQEASGHTFVGLSVNGTIRACLVAGLHKRADKIKSDFKVPDKRFWYVKLKALVSVRDFESLELFARSKKSPIGYEPWVEHLVATGHHRQAVSYIARCEARNRVELYVKAGEWTMAGQECVRKGERAKLIELKSRAPNSIISAQIESLINDMDNAGV